MGRKIHVGDEIIIVEFNDETSLIVRDEERDKLYLEQEIRDNTEYSKDVAQDIASKVIKKYKIKKSPVSFRF